MLDNWGIHLPPQLASAPLQLTDTHRLRLTGTWLNVPAAVLGAAQSSLLYVGVRESQAFLNAIVGLFLSVILVIVVAGAFFVDPVNWHPFIPRNTGLPGHFGWTGVMTAAAVVFFSYTGFEAI